MNASLRMQSRFRTAALATVAFSVCTTVVSAQSVKWYVALAGLPTGIALNYLTNKVYVAVPSFGGATDTLQVIDGTTDKVTASIAIPPVGFVVATDILSNQIFVGGCTLDTNACSVVVLDGEKNKVLANIPVTSTAGLGIEGITVNPVTEKVYVSNASNNEIDIISERTRKVESRISLGNRSPFVLTVNPFSSMLYVTLGTNQVDVIDTKSNNVVSTGYIGMQNVTIAQNLVTGNLFIPNNIPGLSTAAVLDKNAATLTTVPVGNTPYGVDVDFISNTAFIVNTQDGTLSILDGNTNTLKTRLPVTGELVSVNPFTRKAYVTGQDATLTVVSEQ
jgi:YVTN family beta-propeller protein